MFGAVGEAGVAVVHFLFAELLDLVFQRLLVGAELDSEVEHQTARDTTTGKPVQRGRRGAVMADTIGAPQEDD